MSLTNVIKDAGKFFGIKIGRTVPSFGNQLAAYEIEKDAYTLQDGQIFFKKFNISLAGEKSPANAGRV